MLIIGLTTLALTVAICFWLFGLPWIVVGNYRKRSLLWPWVVFVGNRLESFITWKMRHDFNNLHARFNMPSYWNAQNWVAYKLISALIFLLLSAFLGLYLAINIKIILLLGLAAAISGYFLPEKKLQFGLQKKKQQMQRELPFMLDLLCLCVQAGLSLAAALKKTAELAPSGPLRDSLHKAQSLERTGINRDVWLLQWAEQTQLDGVKNLSLALIQADKLGMNLGPLLKAQAEKQRSDRFIRAETLALQAPVKMLFPMVICIFPCTFMIIGFPIVIKLMDFGT